MVLVYVRYILCDTVAQRTYVACHWVQVLGWHGTDSCTAVSNLHCAL
jgi:hypothetical protein